MEYKVKSPKFSDLQSKTLRITAKASELGAFTSTTITIPLADLSSTTGDLITAADVLVAKNLTDATTVTPSISGSNLILTDVAIAATDLFDLVIRLK